MTETLSATLAPAFPYEVAPEFNTNVTMMQNKNEKRVSKWLTPRRAWNLVFDSLSIANFETLRTFYIARKGRGEAFNWVCLLDNTTYLVRFDSDASVFARDFTGHGVVTLRIVQTNA